jgi:hypothetical protein
MTGERGRFSGLPWRLYGKEEAMALGQRRTLGARIGVVLGFVCGVIGFFAGLTGHVWKFGAEGWFVGGVLLTLLSLFALVDGAVAGHKAP